MKGNYLALQELIAGECNPSDAGLLTVGQCSAGPAANILSWRRFRAAQKRGTGKEPVLKAAVSGMAAAFVPTLQRFIV